MEMNQQSEFSKSRVLREQIAKLREGVYTHPYPMTCRSRYPKPHHPHHNTANLVALGLTTERMARELLDERKTKELQVLESAVLIELNKEKSERKEGEAKTPPLPME